MVTISRRTGDHVIDEIIGVVINEERAWETGIESVDELNEMAVEHGSQVIDLLYAAVFAICCG